MTIEPTQIGKIRFDFAKAEKDLCDIIDLQKRNLPGALSPDEIRTQGFVTVSHQLEDLLKMMNHEPSLVMKDGDRLIGYLLAMTSHSRAEIPVLVPMFDAFDKISYLGKTIADYRYLVVGQVCIDKNYRG